MLNLYRQGEVVSNLFFLIFFIFFIVYIMFVEKKESFVSDVAYWVITILLGSFYLYLESSIRVPVDIVGWFMGHTSL